MFVLSIPFYLLGVVTRGLLSAPLPPSAIMVICPLIAAAWLCRRSVGGPGLARELHRRTGPRSPGWLAVALGLYPVVMLASYVLQRASGQHLPVPALTLGGLLLAVALYTVGALCEEIGWMGVALPGLEKRLSPLAAGLLLGVVWWLWHVIPHLVAGKAVGWILWQGVVTVMSRVLMVWLDHRAHRWLATSVAFHVMMNVTWTAFPVNGSLYDPRVTGLVLVATVAVVLVVDRRWWRQAR